MRHLPFIHRPVASGCRAAVLFAIVASSGCSGGGGGGGGGGQPILAGPSRSTSIALTSDDARAVVANRETNSVSILEVRNAQGADAGTKIAEIAVGREPRCVAISPDNARAFVSNTQSGTVSVIQLIGNPANAVVAEIKVGTEPRGIALTPTGSRLYVADHTAGSVSVIDTTTLAVIGTIHLPGNPTAIAITNDADADDLDETVFVTQFYAELIPGGPGEGFDNGKQGVVWWFPTSGPHPVGKIELSPMANAGFSANRAPFCAAFNAQVHSPIFCPDVNEIDQMAASIAQDPQGAYPNQLQSIVLRNGLLYLPSIGAEPEPPVQFRVNVQALVHVADAVSYSERADLQVNLNAQIKNEVQPADPTHSNDRLFGNDIVAIDADAEGLRFLIVSRGGNYVLKAVVDATGKLDIGAPSVVRYQTGNIPSGIVISRDGRRAYANNEVNVSVTAIDLVNDVVITRDIPCGTPPSTGSFAHSVLVGKLAFHTALGLPTVGLFSKPIREITPLENRGQASDNGWSSCASCHPDGLADGVTWIFGTGPRQTIPLDSFFSKESPADQRISNWSGVMGSITDFNNNARGVQGGIGFTGITPAATIFPHGPTQGVSEALDAMTLWVQTVRAPILPLPEDVNAAMIGENLFFTNCASCHAGAKWSKSQVIYDNDPTFNIDPNTGGVAFDPGLTNTGAQIVSFSEGTLTLPFLESTGTFVSTDPLELRGSGAQAGRLALGALGFNVPSLLGLRYHAPYLHNGAAQTLDEVFARHNFGSGTIQSTFTVAADREGLKAFLDSIDGATPTMPSATDVFLQAIGH